MCKFSVSFKHFETFSGTDKIFAWNSKGLLKVTNENPLTSDNSFAPKLTFVYKGRVRAKFEEIAFKNMNYLLPIKTRHVFY